MTIINMSYEDAPATKLLATRCAFCGKPLLDARSVQAGAGPDCRTKYLVASLIGENARVRGNMAIYKIACNPKSKNVPGLIQELYCLGLVKAAYQLADRAKMILIRNDNNKIYVKTPFNHSSAKCSGYHLSKWIKNLSEMPGYKWHRDTRESSIPRGYKSALWNLMLECFSERGMACLGPKGVFVI